MSDSTHIEWTDATWNPVTGCTRISPGCANCYIERTPPFRMVGRRFATVDGESTTGVTLHPERLGQPLRWRKPRRVFVCSLADLFHDEIPYEYVRDVFNTMRCCDGGVVAATGHRDPSHIFQVLTKRPERVLELWRERKLGFTDWPPNVWLGVSIENARYTWRADVLREIPAAVRFISAEPLLGSLYPTTSAPSPGRDHVAGLAPGVSEGRAPTRERAPLDLTEIDWIIVGGESGPGARPFRLEYAREIIRAAAHDADCALNPYASTTAYLEENADLCDCGSSAVFVKQLGARPVESGQRYAAQTAVAIQCDHGYDVCPECDAADVELTLCDRKGGDMDEWPADLRVREFPRPAVAA